VIRAALSLALLAALAAAAEELDGTITGGKAKQLVEEGAKLVAEADEIYKRWFLDELPPETREPEAKRMAGLYEKGMEALAAALEIKYDPAVNHALTSAARRQQKVQFWLFAQERKRVAPEPPKAAPPDPPGPSPPEEEPEPGKPGEVEEPPPIARMEFTADQPPAKPVDVELPRVDRGDPTMVAAREKRAAAAIRQVVKDHLDARRADNLLYKHVPCGGTGKVAGGAPCAECAGSGKGINLFHFRRAFWNCYTPLLRDSPGALESIRAFRARAQADSAALGPLVKSFDIAAIEQYGFWARAQVKETTTAGKSERWMTLVCLASKWYFFTPGTDGELVPK